VNRAEFMCTGTFLARFPMGEEARKHVDRKRGGNVSFLRYPGCLRGLAIRNKMPQRYRCRNCSKTLTPTRGICHAA